MSMETPRQDLWWTDRTGKSNRGADFTGLKLEKRDFRLAILKRARFVQAECEGADFTGATLKNAVFRMAKLNNSIFARATLVGATFAGANLRGADLTRADIREADFRGALGLTKEQVKSAKNWYEAEFDADLAHTLGLSKENPNGSNQSNQNDPTRPGLRRAIRTLLRL